MKCNTVPNNSYSFQAINIPLNFAILMNPEQIRMNHFSETFLEIEAPKVQTLVRAYPSPTCPFDCIQIPVLLFESLKLKKDDKVVVYASEKRIHADAIQIAPLFDPGTTDYTIDLTKYFKADFHAVSDKIMFSIYTRGSILHFIVLKTLPNGLCYADGSTRIVFKREEEKVKKHKLDFNEMIFDDEIKYLVKTLTFFPLKNLSLVDGTLLKLSYGIMIYGKSGTGKTSLLKAISNKISENSIIVDSYNIFQLPFQEACLKLQECFSEAVQNQPFVLMFDNIHLILSNNSKINVLFLSLLEHSIQQPNIIVIGTAQEPLQIERSLIRSGRFSFEMTLKYPNEKQKQEFISKILTGIHYDNETLKSLSSNNDYFTKYSQIEEIINHAIYNMFFKKEFPSDIELLSNMKRKIQISDFPTKKQESDNTSFFGL